MKMVVRSLALAIAACGVVSFSAEATMVGPGQSVSTSKDGFLLPHTFIAEQILPDQVITYTPLPGSATPGTPITLTVSLLNRVYRESDGHLDFQLTSALDRGGLFNDGSSITTGDYSGFTTDVHAGTGNLSRDFSGNLTISAPASVEDPDLGFPFPGFTIQTSATSFNKGGVATYSGDDTFNLFDSKGTPISVAGHAEFTVSGLYQPTANGPVAVPLPPAAYAGLAMLAGIVVTRIRRRTA